MIRDMPTACRRTGEHPSFSRGIPTYQALAPPPLPRSGIWWVSSETRLSLRLGLRSRMRHPGPVAAALIGALDRDAVLVEPERDRAALIGVDAVDHQHERAAAEARRDLAHDRVEPVALGRDACGGGDDRNVPAARAI